MIQRALEYATVVDCSAVRKADVCFCRRQPAPPIVGSPTTAAPLDPMPPAPLAPWFSPVPNRRPAMPFPSSLPSVPPAWSSEAFPARHGGRRCVARAARSHILGATRPHSAVARLPGIGCTRIGGILLTRRRWRSRYPRLGATAKWRRDICFSKLGAAIENRSDALGERCRLTKRFSSCVLALIPTAPATRSFSMLSSFDLSRL